MLDLSLENVVFAYKRGFSLTAGVQFERTTHTAVVGRPGAGISTLLKLIAGTLRPDRGSIRIGTRDVTGVKSSRRPLLYATSTLDVSSRWSVQHALVAAVHQRGLDRVDRQREYDLAVERWRLAPLADRTIGSLSSSESTLVHLAQIELLRPAIVVADRLLERLSPSLLTWAADEIYRVFRIIGATVINAPATHEELGFADSVIVLDAGRVVQRGRTAEVFLAPVSAAAASATGGVSAIPVTVRGNEVESVIGAWRVAQPSFQGNGIALARPDDFDVAARGEDSDMIFSVEEASFVGGRWLATGLLSGGVRLRVSLPRSVNVSKGKLLALRYDPARFTLLASQTAAPASFPPIDVVPPLRETR